MNADFLLLVESGLLVVAALAGRILGRTDRSWRWLALFLVAHAGINWVAIAALDAENPGPLRAADSGLQILALIALLEFARRHRFFLHTPATRWWLAGAAAVLAGCTALTGFWILVPLIATTAGVGGAWGAFWIFRRAQASSPDQEALLRLVALPLPAFAFVSAVPIRDRGWLEFLGQGELGAVAVELGLAAMVAIPLYACFAREQQNGLSRAAAASWRRRRYACAAAIIALGGAGAFVAERVAAANDAEKREQILLRAKLVAAALDVESIRTLRWDEADLANEAYVQLKRLMASIRAANPDLRFVMLMGFDQTEAHFLVDSEPPNSADYSPPGQLYEEADPEYLELLARRQSFVLGPIQDRWGTWVTGSVPLVELGAGRGINLDLDISADQWLAETRRARLPVVYFVLLLCLLLIGSFVAQEHLRESARRLEIARDTAEAATKAKSDFLAMMSHELRTPLAGVIGMLDLLRHSPPAPLQAKYTAVARDSAETLLNILDDILDTAKIEAGKLKIEAVPFRPRDEFKHLCEAAKLRAVGKGLDFQFTFGSALPETLVGDPVRLRQVLANLQNNALKFTESGGIQVTVTCPEVRETNVVLLIAVRDTGCGIDEVTRARLFQKFEQADVSTTRRFGGTGLGLSIVRALAEEMNGSVSVESEPGRGSTFTFVVPLARPAADVVVPVKSGAPVMSRSKARLRVLCAEDDRANQLIASELLTQLGHTVTIAENGAAALDLLRRQPFDFVLMDGRMPVLDGLAATQQLRDPANGALDPKIYVCAASANASELSRKQFLAHGMDDYLTKPLRRESLAAALDRAIQQLRQRGISLPENDETASASPPAGLSEAELLKMLDEPAPAPSATPNLSTGTTQKLVTIFHEDTPQRLAVMRTALATGDADALAGAAHALKSAARYVDAVRVSELAARLEAQAEAADRPALEKLLVQIEHEYDKTRAASGTEKPPGTSA